MKVETVLISLAATGVVATARARKRCRLHGLSLSASAAVNAKFTGLSNLTGLHYFSTTYFFVPWVLPYIDPDHGCWCQTDVGKALTLNLSGSVPVGGVALVSYEG